MSYILVTGAKKMIDFYRLLLLAEVFIEGEIFAYFHPLHRFLLNCPGGKISLIISSAIQRSSSWFTFHQTRKLLLRKIH
jgi:hypothetical protein